MTDNGPNLDDVSVGNLLAGLRRGDEKAAREVHRLFTPRLMALARHQFSGALKSKVDPESVVQSVFCSFFHRLERGQFEFGDYDDLWGLLTVITLRKCSDRFRFFLRACRDVTRETDANVLSLDCEPVDLSQDPIELTILSETLEYLVKDLTDREQRVIELLIAGHTVENIRIELQCGERTVRRIRDRAKNKLKRLYLQD